MDISMKIEGLKELEDKLIKDLPAAVQKKVLRSALMFALTPIQKAAKAKVPKDSGEVAKAIRKKSLLTRANKFKAEAGIHMTSKRKASGWKWHFIEFGTTAHLVKPLKATSKNRAGRDGEKSVLSGGGKIYGKKALIPAISAQPFLRPAFAEKSREALSRFKKQMLKRILKETEK